MTDPSTTDSTTPETQTPEGPKARSRAYGDPVIVDDGGSARIRQRTRFNSNKKMSGLANAGQHFTDNADGLFGATPVLVVSWVTGVGVSGTAPYRRYVLSSGDSVVITFVGDNDENPVPPVPDRTVTLNVITQRLQIVCSHQADEHHHGGGVFQPKQWGYHLPLSKNISSVVYRQSGNPTPIEVFGTGAGAQFAVVYVQAGI